MFHLPCRQHLNSFSMTSPSDDDGPLFGLIEEMMKQREKNRIDGKDPNDYAKFGPLSFDGMKLRAGLYWLVSTGRLLGFASDYYKNIDVIKAAFASETNKQNPKKEQPVLAKEYLVFYFTAVHAGVSMKFPVARYNVEKITPAFLLEVVPKVCHLKLLLIKS